MGKENQNDRMKIKDRHSSGEGANNTHEEIT